MSVKEEGAAGGPNGASRARLELICGLKRIFAKARKELDMLDVPIGDSIINAPRSALYCIHNRKTLKRIKLELRGTYRRKDQWRLELSAKRVDKAAEFLASCLGVNKEELFIKE